MKDTKHIRRYFLFCCLGHAPWVGLRGTGGAQGVNKFFFKHGHVAYQIDGDDKQNKMQVTFSSGGQTGDLGTRSKGQISLTCQFQRFTKMVGLRGAGGVKKFCVGIFNGPPSAARSSLINVNTSLRSRKMLEKLYKM